MLLDLWGRLVLHARFASEDIEGTVSLYPKAHNKGRIEKPH